MLTSWRQSPLSYKTVGHTCERAVGCTHEGRRAWREGANEVYWGFIPATFAIHMRISKTFTQVLFTAAFAWI